MVREVTMGEQRAIIVATEDPSTAGAVCAEAVRLASTHKATDLVLVHVADDHPVINGMLALTGSYVEPMCETPTDCSRLLCWAEELLRAEFTARNEPIPNLRQEVAGGHAGEAIARIAAAHKAEWIVLGARRPHLFGRITHPNVQAHVAAHSHCQVRVAPLQEAQTTAMG